MSFLIVYESYSRKLTLRFMEHKQGTFLCKSLKKIKAFRLCLSTVGYLLPIFSYRDLKFSKIAEKTRSNHHNY